MKTMTSRKEPGSFEAYSPEKAALLHRCPVCGTAHEVSAARAQFAYGRQLACSPDCEAERRRRNRASYRLAPKPVTPGREPSSVALKTAGRDCDGRDSRLQSTHRLAGSDDQKAVLSVTVESTDVLRVRRAVFQSGGKSVGILKAAPVPHSSKVRLFVGTQTGARESVMSAIMRSVGAGEFGHVART